MTYLSAIILGIVEGATEFIPVSSSGHLVVIRELFGINSVQGLAFDAVLQLSATVALIVYFRDDIAKIFSTFLKIVVRSNIPQSEKTLLQSIVFGTVPAVLFGLLLEEKMDTIFRDASLVALALVFGSILMFSAQRLARVSGSLTLFKGILIGFFQSLALIPGVSRSGATISGGLIVGLNKDEAVRFSFILSIPIMLGSGLKKLFEIRGDIFGTELGLILLVGSITSFIVGLLSISFLIRYLKNNNLNIFIFYRIILAILICIYL